MEKLREYEGGYKRQPSAPGKVTETIAVTRISEGIIDDGLALRQQLKLEEMLADKGQEVGTMFEKGFLPVAMFQLEEHWGNMEALRVRFAGQLVLFTKIEDAKSKSGFAAWVDSR